MRVSRKAALSIAALLLSAVAATAAESPALVKARGLFNAANYEGAIDAAAVARKEPMWTDAADLIVARARLERYRQSGSSMELAEARSVLRGVKSASLNPRDQVDLLIGLGQALYFGEVFGAAADLFDTALEKGSETTLEKGSLLGERDRTLLLDWWATALDREAQLRAPDRRTPVYARIGERMDRELHTDPSSAVANYWRVIAARGTGDFDLAWSAAISAWVRSTLNPATTEQLRADLERVVAQALIAERSRAHPARDSQDVVALLTAEWALVKQNWK
jgi:hypothetical protein